MPADYADLLVEIKERIRTERVRVVLAANQAMVLLYWDIGKTILARQERDGWGAGTIDRLSHDLRQAFPDMRGFSPANLKYMRAFATAWPQREVVQEVLAQITWYHNIALLEKADDESVRLWYAAKAREEGWSRNVLAVQIESGRQERQGSAVTNFPQTLPPADSDLATQAFRPRTCSTSSVPPSRTRNGSWSRVSLTKRFLLETRAGGFAFVGQMNLDLRGQLDAPSRRRTLHRPAALQGQGLDGRGVRPARPLAKPLGVADWETRLVELLPDDLKGSLPTIEEIEAELKGTYGMQDEIGAKGP